MIIYSVLNSCCREKANNWVVAQLEKSRSWARAMALRLSSSCSACRRLRVLGSTLLKVLKWQVVGKTFLRGHGGLLSTWVDKHRPCTDWWLCLGVIYSSLSKAHVWVAMPRIVLLVQQSVNYICIYSNCRCLHSSSKELRAFYRWLPPPTPFWPKQPVGEG